MHGRPESGVWSTIPTPSNWEFFGFGTYNYGPTLTPNENANYRHTFTPPAAWAGQRIFVVFEGAMTDATVMINGTSAGPSTRARSTGSGTTSHLW